MTPLTCEKATVPEKFAGPLTGSLISRHDALLAGNEDNNNVAYRQHHVPEVSCPKNYYREFVICKRNLDIITCGPFNFSSVSMIR